MRLNILDIPAEGAILLFDTPAKAFVELKRLEAEGECIFTKNILSYLEITKLVDFITVKGKIETKTNQICGRCLKEFDFSIDHHFVVNYSRELPEYTFSQEDVSLKTEEMDLVYYEGDTLDFHDVIQEQVILSLPLRPLCRESCKGLCPNCGENLNSDTCQCTARSGVDPRLSVLRNIKIQPDKK